MLYMELGVFWLEDLELRMYALGFPLRSEI